LKCHLELLSIILKNKSSIEINCPFLHDELKFWEIISRIHDPNRTWTCLCDPSKGACKDTSMCHIGLLRRTSIFDLLLVTRSKMYYEVELKLKVKSTSKVKDHVKKCCEQFSGPCCNYEGAGRVERIVVFRNKDIAGRAKNYYRSVSMCRFIIITLSEDDVRKHIR